MAWTQEKIETTLQSVLKKAQEDAAFREKLKSNPKETLAAQAGEMIPDAFRIAIIDQNDTDIVITLPKVQTDELSDADLEHVAGGKAYDGGEVMIESYLSKRANATNGLLYMRAEDVRRN